MDSYREHSSDFDVPATASAPAVDDVASVIGTDERRMHVRAYNHWVSLLNGRDFPSIEDLEPADVEGFSAHSVLLDFTCGGSNPAIPYIGAAIRDECGFDDGMRNISDVPSRSLLSRLTDHYMQIIANRAPVGFEAEFENPMGETLCYRGILMPFSSDGEAIDFIYGVINWKHATGAAEGGAQRPLQAQLAPLEADPVAGPEPLDLDSPLHLDAPLDLVETREFGDDDDEAIDAAPAPLVDADAGLADHLFAARELAEAAKAGEGRSRAALYRALAQAYDFAVAADRAPEDYAELLADSGVKAQARAPMTPVVKLVFGVDYDKARLTEFAAALSFARRQSVPSGDFQQLIEGQPGGLKALVAAERAARRPYAAPDDREQRALAALASATPVNLAQLQIAGDFAVVIVRRNAQGGVDPVGLVEEPAIVARAARRAR